MPFFFDISDNVEKHRTEKGLFRLLTLLFMQASV